MYRGGSDCCFFFYYSGDIEDLHSFPTRRSSDLGEHLVLAAVVDVEPVKLGLVGRARQVNVARDERGPARSEEHTSELQSRRDLVCRLLLEKKNVAVITNVESSIASIPRILLVGR